MRKLYIEQKIFKITDHYPVTDETGETVYFVDQDFKFFGFSVDITGSNGDVLCHIDRKIISFLPTFFLNFSDGLVLTMKSRFSLFRKKIDIDPDNLGIYIEGNFFSHTYSVYKDNELIGSIKKAYFSFRDRFELEIYNPEYELIFVAIVVAVDHIMDNEASAGASHSASR